MQPVSFLQLPLRPEVLVQKQDHDRCTLAESVSQHIHLMITSRLYENKHDSRFGNELWENDFSNLTKNNAVKEKIKQSLLGNILQYEKRLEKIRVDLSVSQEDVNLNLNHRMKERIVIEVTGLLKPTGDPFIHHEYFYVAPLSYY